MVVGEWKHKECCVVNKGEWQERHSGIIGCRKVLGEKERSWMTRMAYYNTRRAAQKHECLHHAILGEGDKERWLENLWVRTMQLSPFRDSSVVCTLLRGLRNQISSSAHSSVVRGHAEVRALGSIPNDDKKLVRLESHW